MVDKLKKLFLFENLPDDILSQIAKESQTVSFQDGNIIFYEGDPSRYLYLTQKGEVKLYKSLANANELVLKYFKADEVIAEVAVFKEIPYPATAQAMGEVELIKIDFKNLKELFLSNPEILLKIQSSLINKIKNLENLLSRYLILDAKGRVIDYILKNEEQFFTLKQTEIAKMLNLTPETLSRVLKPFKADGIIDMKAKTLNADRLALYKT